MKPILAPHRVQDGWRYVRVPSSIVSPLGAPRESDEVVFAARLSLTNSIATPGLETHLELSYRDDVPCHRIISSRRVEEAVETTDFLKLCAEEGLTVTKFPLIRNADMRWRVEAYTDVEPAGYGDTLRSAYYRYHAAAGDAK